MFNNELKKKALTALEQAQDNHKSCLSKLTDATEKLFLLRESSSFSDVKAAEAYVNSLVDTPESLQATFAEYHREFKVFSRIYTVDELQARFESFDVSSHPVSQSLAETALRGRSVNLTAAATAAGGVATGVGTAALAPTAAMAIATSFGTASTGTAISALSGTAATNAALAWLGGGAVAAGGGGVSGGAALLSVAGPVGVAISGVALIGGGLYALRKNAKIAEEVEQRRKSINEEIDVITDAVEKLTGLYKLTFEHVRGLSVALTLLRSPAAKNYASLTAQERKVTQDLLEHVDALKLLLNQKVHLG